METLPRDVVEKITKELPVRDFLRFCLGNPQCNNKDLWYRRFQRDFPHILNVAGITKENAKEKYLKLIEIISRNAEETADEILKLHGYAGEFLKKTKFRTKLISQLYDNYLEIVENIDDWENAIYIYNEDDSFYSIRYELNEKVKKYMCKNVSDEFMNDFFGDEGTPLLGQIQEELGLSSVSPPQSPGGVGLPRLPSPGGVGLPRLPSPPPRHLTNAEVARLVARFRLT